MPSNGNEMSGTLDWTLQFFSFHLCPLLNVLTWKKFKRSFGRIDKWPSSSIDNCLRWIRTWVATIRCHWNHLGVVWQCRTNAMWSIIYLQAGWVGVMTRFPPDVHPMGQYLSSGVLLICLCTFLLNYKLKLHRQIDNCHCLTVMSSKFPLTALSALSCVPHQLVPIHYRNST